MKTKFNEKKNQGNTPCFFFDPAIFSVVNLEKIKFITHYFFSSLRTAKQKKVNFIEVLSIKEILKN